MVVEPRTSLCQLYRLTARDVLFLLHASVGVIHAVDEVMLYALAEELGLPAPNATLPPTESPVIGIDDDDISDEPSDSPSEMPSVGDDDDVSGEPSDTPSDSPSDVPSEETPLSDGPSDMPSDTPSEAPSEASSSDEPSDVPSDTPSDSPSDMPSDTPSDSDSSSDEPSDVPSDSPSERLTSSGDDDTASDEPSDFPSDVPSEAPSAEDLLTEMPTVDVVGVVDPTEEPTFTEPQETGNTLPPISSCETIGEYYSGIRGWIGPCHFVCLAKSLFPGFLSVSDEILCGDHQ